MPISNWWKPAEPALASERADQTFIMVASRPYMMTRSMRAGGSEAIMKSMASWIGSLLTPTTESDVPAAESDVPAAESDVPAAESEDGETPSGVNG